MYSATKVFKNISLQRIPQEMSYYDYSSKRHRVMPVAGYFKSLYSVCYMTSMRTAEQ